VLLLFLGVHCNNTLPPFFPFHPWESTLHSGPTIPVIIPDLRQERPPPPPLVFGSPSQRQANLRNYLGGFSSYPLKVSPSPLPVVRRIFREFDSRFSAIPPPTCPFPNNRKLLFCQTTVCDGILLSKFPCPNFQSSSRKPICPLLSARRTLSNNQSFFATTGVSLDLPSPEINLNFFLKWDFYCFKYRFFLSPSTEPTPSSAGSALRVSAFPRPIPYSE